MPSNVFLSYSGRDLDEATAVSEALQARGLSVWFDRLEVRADDHAFPSALSEGLIGARVLCVLCSPNSTKSEWVEREVMQFLLLARSSPRRQIETGICFITSMDLVAAALPSLDQIRKHGASERVLAPEAGLIGLSNNLLEAMKASLRRSMVSYVSDDRDQLAAKVKWFHDSLVPKRSARPAITDLNERILQAEHFWEENNVMARSGWVSPDFASLLPRLDSFCASHDRWAKRSETARGARIRDVLESMLTGSITTAANVPSQKSAHNIFERNDLLISMASEGSAVTVLSSMANDGNLLEDLQHVHYNVRSKLSDDPGLRDLVDLSVILVGGYSVDRWVLMNVPRDRVIESLLAEEALAELD